MCQGNAYGLYSKCIYILIAQHLAANTCGSYDEIQMSPVIIDPICVFLRELRLDIS